MFKKEKKSELNVIYCNASVGETEAGKPLELAGSQSNQAVNSGFSKRPLCQKSKMENN